METADDDDSGGGRGVCGGCRGRGGRGRGGGGGEGARVDQNHARTRDPGSANWPTDGRRCARGSNVKLIRDHTVTVWFQIQLDI